MKLFRHISLPMRLRSPSAPRPLPAGSLAGFAPLPAPINNSHCPVNRRWLEVKGPSVGLLHLLTLNLAGRLQSACTEWERVHDCVNAGWHSLETLHSGMCWSTEQVLSRVTCISVLTRADTVIFRILEDFRYAEIFFYLNHITLHVLLENNTHLTKLSYKYIINRFQCCGITWFYWYK